MRRSVGKPPPQAARERRTICGMVNSTIATEQSVDEIAMRGSASQVVRTGMGEGDAGALRLSRSTPGRTVPDRPDAGAIHALSLSHRRGYRTGGGVK